MKFLFFVIMCIQGRSDALCVWVRYILNLNIHYDALNTANANIYHHNYLQGVLVSYTYTMVVNGPVVCVCGCVCVCVSVYICTFLHVCVWVSLYVAVCVYVCVFVRICVSLYVPLWVCLYLCMCLSVGLPVCVCVTLFLSVCWWSGLVKISVESRLVVRRVP